MAPPATATAIVLIIEAALSCDAVRHSDAIAAGQDPASLGLVGGFGLQTT